MRAPMVYADAGRALALIWPWARDHRTDRTLTPPVGPATFTRLGDYLARFDPVQLQALLMAYWCPEFRTPFSPDLFDCANELRKQGQARALEADTLAA